MRAFRDPKILLIWPYGAFDRATLPLAYTYLIPTLRRHGYRVDFLDCAVGDIAPDAVRFRHALESYQPHIVGVSAWSVHKTMATEALRKVKAFSADILTMAGGPHFSGDPEYSLATDQGVIDFVFKGEAEESLIQFLGIICHGEWSYQDLTIVPGLCFLQPDGLVHETPAKSPASLDALGQPDYDVINLPLYLKQGYAYRSDSTQQAAIVTTRGCPYTCDFCSAPFLNGRRVRKHSPAYLLELLRSLYDRFDVRHFNIIDDNFTFDVPYAKQFCKMVIDNQDWLREVSFGTPNGIRIEKTDEDLFFLMKAAGWKRVIVAPESGSQKMVDLMAKHLKLSIVQDKVAQIQKAGLECEAFFIVGHPGEDRQTVAETKRFIQSVKFDVVSLHLFQPLEGTPIYSELVTMGTLAKGDTIRSYDEINWVPEGWTRPELYAVYQDLMETSVKVYPFRFEWLFSKYSKVGRVVSILVGEQIRQICFTVAFRVRRRVSESWFNRMHGLALKRRVAAIEVQSQGKKDLQGLENQMIQIMNHSDELKSKANDFLKTQATEKAASQTVEWTPGPS